LPLPCCSQSPSPIQPRIPPDIRLSLSAFILPVPVLCSLCTYNLYTRVFHSVRQARERRGRGGGSTRLLQRSSEGSKAVFSGRRERLKEPPSRDPERKTILWNQPDKNEGQRGTRRGRGRETEGERRQNSPGEVLPESMRLWCGQFKVYPSVLDIEEVLLRVEDDLGPRWSWRVEAQGGGGKSEPVPCCEGSWTEG
jgi:hypothetical protein